MSAYNKMQTHSSSSDDSLDSNLHMPVSQSYARSCITQNPASYTEGNSMNLLTFPPSPPTNIPELDNPKANNTNQISLSNFTGEREIINSISHQNQSYQNSVSVPYMGPSSLNQAQLYSNAENSCYPLNNFTYQHHYHHEHREITTEIFQNPVSHVPYPQRIAQNQSLSPPLNENAQGSPEKLFTQPNFPTSPSVFGLGLNETPHGSQGDVTSQKHAVTEQQYQEYEPASVSDYSNEVISRSQKQTIPVPVVSQRPNSASQVSENADKRFVFHRRVGNRRKPGENGKTNRVEKSLHIKRKSQDFIMESSKAAKVSSLYPDSSLFYTESELMTTSPDRGLIPNNNVYGTMGSTPSPKHTSSPMNSLDPEYRQNYISQNRDGHYAEYRHLVSDCLGKNSDSSRQLSQRHEHVVGFQSGSHESYPHIREEYVSESGHSINFSTAKTDSNGVYCGRKASNTSYRDGGKHPVGFKSEASSSKSSLNSDYGNHSSTESIASQPDYKTKKLNNAYKRDLDQFMKHFKIQPNEYNKLKEIFSRQFESLISNVKQECNKLDEFGIKEIGPELVLDYVAELTDLKLP